MLALCREFLLVHCILYKIKLMMHIYIFVSLSNGLTLKVIMMMIPFHQCVIFSRAQLPGRYNIFNWSLRSFAFLRVPPPYRHVSSVRERIPITRRLQRPSISTNSRGNRPLPTQSLQYLPCAGQVMLIPWPP